MWVSIVIAVVLGIALVAGITGTILYRNLSDQIVSSTLDTSHLDEQAESETPIIDSFEGRDVNILLMGIDSRQNQEEGLINEGDDDETTRSDTTLLMNISADRQHVTLVSIPRDLWVYLPDCTRTDGSVSPEQWGQFNWAFSYGSYGDDLAGGVACTEKTVEELTGVPIDGFAVIDFSGFAQMVEALGGIEVCLEEPINDEEYLGLTLPAGCQVLDPIIATQYARVRYVGDGSDMGRIQRQQDLLGSMVVKALDQNLLTDMPQLYSFLSAALDTTRLSPSLSSLRTDAGLASSIKNTPRSNIRFVTMPVVTADFDMNRLLPKEPENGALWESIINGENLPAGTVFMDLEGNYYTMTEDGFAEPGGDPRTDDEIGSFTGDEG